ncbi:PH domain-containing protein [Streptomyces capillispiralis]|uniref:PH domain-containing protein n=1 Tax=Streptomyces capillispiralis TaxID=68182 RepID=UPI0011AA9861|nr:PH domain-containing protein [Streptomyces capillispiralis]
MIDAREVTCRPRWTRTLWCFAGLGAAGAAAAVVLGVRTSTAAWPALGLLFALAGFAALHRVTARVRADAHGLHSRTLLRRRSVPWSEVADLRLRVKYANTARGEESRRVSALLRDGRGWVLPLPRTWTPRTEEFDATLSALRELHRRHGAAGTTAEPARLTVISHRTTGSGWTGSLALCVLLLAGAGLALRMVPQVGAYEREWESAAPCAAGTSWADHGDCLSTVPAVIERTDPRRPKKTSRLYFTDARPLERLAVSEEAALEFRSGDRVRLTFWRGEVKTIAGDRHVWRDHTPGAGDVVMVAAGLTLGAGYPAARILIRLRGRRRPDGEVLPSALPFAVALVLTALWLLPLCFLHPTAPFASPVTTAWAAAGTLVTIALLTWAWRATRFRPPGGPEPLPTERTGDEVFLPARFLEATDYNPRHFGTHIVLGDDGPPAVVPHSGPGRFAARPVPVSRLTLERTRRAGGGDPDTIPRTWHIAELDDAGTPVRLAAAPTDLTRILRALRPTAPEARAGTRPPGDP